MVLFKFATRVRKHWSIKNANKIRKAGNRYFIGKDQELLNDKEFLTLELKQAWKKDTITQPIHAQFKFYFVDYYTKKGEMNKRLGDLSNIIQMPEDCLQAAGIIQDDALILSYDGSRKLPSDRDYDYIEITLSLFDG